MDLIQEEDAFRTKEYLQDVQDARERQEEVDEQTQTYLEIKLDIYRAKEEILKKHGLSWKKFYDMEDMVKRIYANKENGVIYLHDGYIAVVTKKDILLHKGNPQVIGQEVSHISIHKERIDNGKK